MADHPNRWEFQLVRKPHNLIGHLIQAAWTSAASKLPIIPTIVGKPRCLSSLSEHVLVQYLRFLFLLCHEGTLSTFFPCYQAIFVVGSPPPPCLYALKIRRLGDAQMTFSLLSLPQPHSDWEQGEGGRRKPLLVMWQGGRRRVFLRKPTKRPRKRPGTAYYTYMSLPSPATKGAPLTPIQDQKNNQRDLD